MAPEGARPLPRRPFVFVDGTYPGLCERAVASGPQEWGPDTFAVRHGDVPQHSGAFAVPKDETEDRVTYPLEFANDCCIDANVPALVAPYFPQIAAVTKTPGSRVKLSKRDARHYFHCFRFSSAWRRWLAVPPARRLGELRPRWLYHRAWPMGFKPSAAVAQPCTEAAAARAKLLWGRQLRPGTPTPREMPLWGLIVDDAIVISEDPPAVSADPPVEAWLPELERHWEEAGVAVHPGKRVDFEENAEALGFEVDAAGVIQLSPAKAWHLQLGLALCGLSSWRLLPVDP